MKDRKLRKLLLVQEDCDGGLSRRDPTAENLHQRVVGIEEKVDMLIRYLGVHIRTDEAPPAYPMFCFTGGYGHKSQFVKNDKKK